MNRQASEFDNSPPPNAGMNERIYIPTPLYAGTHSFQFAGYGHGFMGLTKPCRRAPQSSIRDANGFFQDVNA